MARNHARIYSSIWAKRDWRRRSMDAQCVWQSLQSQPDLGHAGVLSYTPAKWASMSADGTIERIEKAIVELEAAGFVLVDRDTHEILLRTHLYNDGVWKQPKVLAVAKDEMTKIASPLIRVCLLHELQALDTATLPATTRGAVEAELEDLPEALHEALEELEFDTGYPPPEGGAQGGAEPPLDDPAYLDAQGDRGRGGGNGGEVQGTPTPSPAPAINPEPPLIPAADIDAPAPKHSGYPAAFETWYAQYPRRTAKGAALRAWQSARKRIDEIELLKTTRDYAEFAAEFEDPQFVPYPATWLNRRQYEDDLDEKRKTARRRTPGAYQNPDDPNAHKNGWGAE